ncbi:alphaK I14 [Puccinia graminis f. sp. tritici CRL 75-36-700-3]|uniref:AlphaK I14 n=1 Tax=Puccinia graminis f. sp. tritici (strain CRL 75-36-700-3 / race SCCL) TaxID=418459 RepID=E3JZ38_PUCGT|nr:alphaK I14 [Puccinia graminis f. sp. tritici CRL 75-36-700-3]EFP77313.2 alphaK I14 [Puccinia graminis f. sp. tritici CRL 75-36-700-3]
MSRIQGPSTHPTGPSTSHTQIHQRNLHTAGPSYSPISRHSVNTRDTGTHVFYQGLAKEARAAKKQETSTPKLRRASTSRTPDPKSSPEKRFVKAGVTVYIDDVLQKKTGIIPKVLEVDTKKPNFYEDFRHQLWGLFSDEILAKTEITYPPDPEQYTCLGTNNSKIEEHNILLELARAGKTIKSASVIHLIYQHPMDNFPETDIPTQSRTNQKRKYQGDQSKASKSAAWALGGKIATKPVRGSASLSSQVDTLSHPISSQSITMKTDGWISALRLHFYTIHEQPPPEASRQSFTINDYIHAVTFPFDIKVDSGKVLGEGSSRRSYPAQVRSIENGREVINKWVAKLRYSDSTPNVINHASDAITYRGFGLILAEFKDFISNKLDGVLKVKGNQIELVRHCVVVVGKVDNPTNVYFFESYLVGSFVKYSSNLNFNVSANQKGMDVDYLSLMNALTHWSYNQSKGQRLVCDLQGFGAILTDPQMVDLNADSWAEGNSAGDGIAAFLQEHICPTVCNILHLGNENKAVDLKWTRPTPRQPLAFDRILASKNRGVFDGSDIGSSEDGDLPEVIWR